MIGQAQVHRIGSGPPLVLLHCLGVDHALWDIAAEGLDDQFELIRYDFPGHGTSSVPQHSYTIEDLAGQLASLLDRENLGIAHIAGISLGGLVAQCFAARNPNRVDKLLLIDTTPRYTDQMRAAWHERANVARTQGVGAMTDHLLDVWFTSDAIAANGPSMRYVREQFAKCSGEGYALACEALAGADLRSCLPTDLRTDPHSSAGSRISRALSMQRISSTESSPTLSFCG